MTLKYPVFGIYSPLVLVSSFLIGSLISMYIAKVAEPKILLLVGGFLVSLFNGLAGCFFYLF